MLRQYILTSLLTESRIDGIKTNNPDIPETIIDHYADTALPDNNKAHLDWVIKQHRLGNITPDTAASIRPHIESYIRNKNSLGKLKDYDVASLKNATNDLLDKNPTKNEIIDKDTKTIYDSKNMRVQKHLTYDSARKGRTLHKGNSTTDNRLGDWCVGIDPKHFNDYTEHGHFYTVENKHGEHEKTGLIANHKLTGDDMDHDDFGSDSYQVRDENDETISPTDVLNRHKELAKVPELDRFFSKNSGYNNLKKVYSKYGNSIESNIHKMNNNEKETLLNTDVDDSIKHNILDLDHNHEISNEPLKHALDTAKTQELIDSIHNHPNSEDGKFIKGIADKSMSGSKMVDMINSGLSKNSIDEFHKKVGVRKLETDDIAKLDTDKNHLGMAYLSQRNKTPLGYRDYENYLEHANLPNSTLKSFIKLETDNHNGADFLHAILKNKNSIDGNAIRRSRENNYSKEELIPALKSSVLLPYTKQRIADNFKYDTPDRLKHTADIINNETDDDVLSHVLRTHTIESYRKFGSPHMLLDIPKILTNDKIKPSIKKDIASNSRNSESDIEKIHSTGLYHKQVLDNPNIPSHIVNAELPKDDNYKNENLIHKADMETIKKVYDTHKHKMDWSLKATYRYEHKRKAAALTKYGVMTDDEYNDMDGHLEK